MLDKSKGGVTYASRFVLRRHTAAAATFKEHGFCVLLDVLDEERLATIRAGCAKVVKAVVKDSQHTLRQM